MEGIVKNNTAGYGYNYAQLSDIVAQGYKLPVMVTKVLENGEEYVFFKDEKGEWLQGARVVVPESKSMNKAQLYGSALTYARRYTAYMALALACSDTDIENLNPDGTRKDANGEKPTGKPTTKATAKNAVKPSKHPARDAVKPSKHPARDAVVAFCEEHGLNPNDIAVAYHLTGNSSEEDFAKALDFMKEEYK